MQSQWGLLFCTASSASKNSMVSPLDCGGIDIEQSFSLQTQHFVIEAGSLQTFLRPGN